MNILKFWAVFVIGVTAGACVALIYAPQSGESTRRQLRQNMNDAGDYLKETASTVGERAQDVFNRGKDKVSDISDAAQQAAGAARKAASQSS